MATLESLLEMTDCPEKAANTKHDLTTMKPSLGKVMVLYLEHAPVLKKTRRMNCLSLLQLFSVTTGKQIIPENTSLEALTPALLMDYQSAKVKEYEAIAPKDEPSQREAKERALRSSRSRIAQARSLFARAGQMDMIALYKEHGVELPPNIKEFMEHKPRGRLTKNDYRAPSDAAVEAAFYQVDLMRRDLPLYLGFWLAAGLGLRRKEIRFARWEHVIEIDGRGWYRGGIGKNNEPINVPFQARAYAALLPYQKPDGWIIPERGDRWCRRLSAWMRAMGWTTRLTLHELRAYLGSRIYAKDPVAAMRQLRHSSITTTERSYVRYALQSEIQDVL